MARISFFAFFVFVQVSDLFFVQMSGPFFPGGGPGNSGRYAGPSYRVQGPV